MTARAFLRSTTILGGVSLLLMLAPWPPSAVAATNNVTDVRTLVAGNSAFAFDLYARLRERPGNLFLSPYSLSTVLAMTYGGARENTARQMAQALHFDLEPGKLHTAFGELQRRLVAAGTSEGVELTTANSIWVQKGYPIRPGYTNLCLQTYRGLAWPVDFASAPEAACKTVNNWVAAQTRRRITDLIRPAQLTPETMLVLVNAISFKGQWLSRFWQERTRPAPFHVTADQTVNTPLMLQRRVLGYGKVDGVQVLVMRYRGQQWLYGSRPPTGSAGFPRRPSLPVPDHGPRDAHRAVHWPGRGSEQVVARFVDEPAGAALGEHRFPCRRGTGILPVQVPGPRPVDWTPQGGSPHCRLLGEGLRPCPSTGPKVSSAPGDLRSTGRRGRETPAEPAQIRGCLAASASDNPGSPGFSTASGTEGAGRSSGGGD